MSEIMGGFSDEIPVKMSDIVTWISCVDMTENVAYICVDDR